MAKLRLKELRKERGLSQSGLGDAIGVNWRTISSYELGKREPDIDTIVKFCKFFGVSADYFLGLDESDGKRD